MISLFLIDKSTFESGETTAVSSARLCLEIPVCGVINKAGMRFRSVHDVISLFSSALHW